MSTYPTPTLDSFTLNGSQTANQFLASPNGTAGAPTFRTLVGGDLPLSGVTAGTYGDATHTLTASVDATGRLTGISTNVISGGGTTFTFTPQTAPTLVAGVTWGDSTQNALQTYIDGASGWLPTILAVGTAKPAIALTATATSLFPSTFIGTLTLPANFFVVGKTIEIDIAGYITTAPASSAAPTPSLILGGTTIGGSALGGPIDTSASSFTMKYIVTCLTTGASGTVMSFCRGSTDGNQSAIAQTSSSWNDGNNGATSTLNTTVANLITPKLAVSTNLTLTVTSARIMVIA